MPKFIDMTNQIINRITVIEQAPRKNGRTMWKCKCHCGNIFIVNGADLRSGHTKSCGCLRRKNKINEIGNRYGRLQVIDYAPNDQNGNSRWKCLCDCGNVIITKGARLRNGGVLSCGCIRTEKLIQNNYNRRKNLLNQKFGLLTVIQETEKRNNNRSIVWKCQCECGNITYVSEADLISGNTKSCGCNRYKSYGETKIKQILIDNNIPFIQEKRYSDLIFPDTGYQARFDFYVNNKYIIEYDGIQHFIQGNGVFDNSEKFQQTQEHDKIKNEYCHKHNIPIIRIPYTELENLTVEMLQPETSKYLLKTI